ncbi:MAG: hypothetical protein ABIG44_00275 [Planctomycetota bacterium]
MPTPKTYTKSGNRTTTRQRTYNRHTSKKFDYFKCSSPAFKPARNECEWRIGSYRTVYTQFTGPAKQTIFSPTTANKWLKYVNSGYRVYKFTNQQFNKYFGEQWTTKSPTACYRWMKQQYGAGIKAVTRGKANAWLIAATPKVNQGPFGNYTWK